MIDAGRLRVGVVWTTMVPMQKGERGEVFWLSHDERDLDGYGNKVLRLEIVFVLSDAWKQCVER